MDLVKMLFDYKQKNNLSLDDIIYKTNISKTSLRCLFLGERVAGDKIKFKIAKFFHKFSIKEKILFDNHGAAIKYYRQLLGLSQRQVGRLAGHSDRTTICGLERNKDKMDAKKRNNLYSNTAILALEKFIGREIVVRNYLPNCTKCNIAKNIIEKHYLVKVEIFKKMGVKPTNGYRMLDYIDRCDDKTIANIARAMNVNVKIFYDREFALNYFKQNGTVLKGR